eukprot:gene9100-228_t
MNTHRPALLCFWAAVAASGDGFGGSGFQGTRQLWPARADGEVLEAGKGLALLHDWREMVHMMEDYLPAVRDEGIRIEVLHLLGTACRWVHSRTAAASLRKDGLVSVVAVATDQQGMHDFEAARATLLKALQGPGLGPGQIRLLRKMTAGVYDCMDAFGPAVDMYGEAMRGQPEGGTRQDFVADVIKHLVLIKHALLGMQHGYYLEPSSQATRPGLEKAQQDVVAYLLGLGIGYHASGAGATLPDRARVVRDPPSALLDVAWDVHTCRAAVPCALYTRVAPCPCVAHTRASRGRAFAAERTAALQDYPGVGDLVDFIKGHHTRLVTEYKGLQASGNMLREDECISSSRGEFEVGAAWTHLDAQGCSFATPVACTLWQAMGKVQPADKVVRMAYSAIGGHSWIRPHFGMSSAASWHLRFYNPPNPRGTLFEPLGRAANTVLKLHLGLIVPIMRQDGKPCAEIRVADTVGVLTPTAGL